MNVTAAELFAALGLGIPALTASASASISTSVRLGRALQKLEDHGDRLDRVEDRLDRLKAS